MAAPYITKAEVLVLAQILKSDLTDIPDDFMDASGEIIEGKTKVWEIVTADQYLNGEGTNFIFCPTVPINSLTGLYIIASDTSEESLDVSGTDRQVWFDGSTGQIRRIAVNRDIARYPDAGDLDAPLFPTGLQNIRISGNFGKGPYKILKVLQTMLIFQMLERIYPKEFKAGDIVSEKLGEYSYNIGVMEYTKDPKNQKKTLEGYIDWLFDQLPKDEYEDMVLAV